MAGELCSIPLFALNGILAGCGFASTFAKVYVLEPIDELIKKHTPTAPQVQLDFALFVDDGHFAAHGEREALAKVIADIASDFKEVSEVELHCTIAMNKSALVTSDLATTEAIKKQFRFDIPVKASAVNLGADHTSGKTRHSSSLQTRKARFAKVNARAPRIRRLTRAVPGKAAHKLTTTGLRPAGSYASEITGLSDAELLRARRLYARTLKPTARGRSLDVLLLICGDPAADDASAPAARRSFLRLRRPYRAQPW